MSEKHTPEPWRWVDGKGIVGSDGWPIATVPGHEASLFRRLVGEREANARRIVSAVNACEGINPDAVPLMREALRRIVANVDRKPNDPYDVGILRAVRRALAKAEEVSP